MSTKNTKFPKNSNRSIHQGTTIVGRNGLAVDSLATLEPGKFLVNSTQSLVSYVSPVVTVDSSVDLSNILTYNNKNYSFTGILILTDAKKNSYIIDTTSINNTSKTFNIYLDEDFTTSPTSIDLSSGWLISEAELVNRLQTTSSAVIDNVEFRDVSVNLGLDSNEDSIAIKDTDGDELNVNTDGSINVIVQDIAIDSTDGDSILVVGTEDGTPTGTQHNLKVGSDKNLRVKDEDATTILNNIYAELQDKTEPNDTQNIRLLDFTTDSIDVSGSQIEVLNSVLPNGAATEAKQDDINNNLLSIELELQNGVLQIGTEDGQVSGIKRVFVNNIKEQILAAKDRDQEISYADFGTKNQRVVQIDYTAPSIGTGTGFIARKTFIYSLVGNRYRRDNITWSIV